MAKTTQSKYKCFYCEKEYVESNYYKSNSTFFGGIGKIPYCKNCLEKFYQLYYEKYMNEGYSNAEQEAVKRICMFLDIYYNATAFNNAMNDIKRRKINISPWAAYMKIIQLNPHNKKSYDDTIAETRFNEEELIMSMYGYMSDDNDEEKPKIDKKTIEFFGAGFQDDDYIFLKREYDDWTARHECKTKAQEEVFKDICFNRLQNLKALRTGEDTKDITLAFQRLLDSGKLQPKQNAGDTMADNQTFGTLIDKWENTRPLPDIDEELKDVDKIGTYIDTFFKGHTCKMLDKKNAFSNLYSAMMKKFTVNKPEYESDEDYEEMEFDKRFGKSLNDLDNNQGVI